uniref:Uncharacterized protein n=1 Tax=Cacopsylla melanoneura TaxID=428564 RepID=A0A8D8ZMJ5_9HEMI
MFANPGFDAKFKLFFFTHNSHKPSQVDLFCGGVPYLAISAHKTSISHLIIHHQYGGFVSSLFLSQYSTLLLLLRVHTFLPYPNHPVNVICIKTTPLHPPQTRLIILQQPPFTQNTHSR